MKPSANHRARSRAEAFTASSKQRGDSYQRCREVVGGVTGNRVWLQMPSVPVGGIEDAQGDYPQGDFLTADNNEPGGST